LGDGLFDLRGPQAGISVFQMAIDRDEDQSGNAQGRGGGNDVPNHLRHEVVQYLMPHHLCGENDQRRQHNGEPADR